MVRQQGCPSWTAGVPGNKRTRLIDQVERSTARLLSLESALDQFVDEQLNMVALDLDHAFFERAAGTAAALERTGQLLEFSFSEGNAGYGRYRLAAPPFAFPANTSDAITRGNQQLLADAGVQRLAAIWAVAPRIGGKDQTAKAGKGRGFLGHTQPLEDRNRRDKAQRHKAVQFNSKTGALEGLRSALLQTPPNSTTAPH